MLGHEGAHARSGNFTAPGERPVEILQARVVPVGFGVAEQGKRQHRAHHSRIGARPKPPRLPRQRPAGVAKKTLATGKWKKSTPTLTCPYCSIKGVPVVRPVQVSARCDDDECG